MLAFCAPVLLALFQAQHISVQHQADHALDMATSLLHRSERISHQVDAAVRALRQLHAPDPCSAAAMAAMRRATVRSDMLIDVGYIQDDELECSAYGRHSLAIGPARFLSPAGYEIRNGITHPLAGDVSVIISRERSSGYAGILRDQLPLRDITEHEAMGAGVVSLQQELPIARTGSFDPRWLDQIDSATNASRYDAGRIVAWARSATYPYVAYVALSPEALIKERRRLVALWVPLGLVVGVLMAYAVSRGFGGTLLARRRIQQAMARGEFHIHYQPVVHLRSGRWIGVALNPRWRRPGDACLERDALDAELDRTRLADRFTEWMLHTAESDVPRLLTHQPGLYVMLSLSAQAVASPALVKRVQTTLLHTGLKARKLCMEVPADTLVAANAEQGRQTLKGLRELGVRIVIKDIGVGECALPDWALLDADGLRIQQHLFAGSANHTVLARIVAVAKALRLAVMADGVESLAHELELRRLGVPWVQGHGYGKPLTIEQCLKGLSHPHRADVLPHAPAITVQGNSVTTAVSPPPADRPTAGPLRAADRPCG